jgi:hypothetical protein
MKISSIDALHTIKFEQGQILEIGDVTDVTLGGMGDFHERGSRYRPGDCTDCTILKK